MAKVAIVTDSNSGITRQEAEKLGISVLPMPFYINEELFYEGISLTQEEFYRHLEDNADISTSQPAPGDVIELWQTVLKDNDALVYIPMSSALSGSCETAKMLAEDFDGRVQVVDNQRISVTQRQSVRDAILLASQGMDAATIRSRLEETSRDSSIYITVETLKYLKKGGRITATVAALGTVLNLKPVLQIQGGKLDSYSRVRGMKAAHAAMIDAIRADLNERFADLNKNGEMCIQVAYSGTDRATAESWQQELQQAFPGQTFMDLDPLSLSVSCHIGPGALAVTCTRVLR